MNNILVIVFSMLTILICCFRYKKISTVLIVGFTFRFLLAILYSFFGDSDPDGYGIKAVQMVGDSFFETLMNLEIGAYTYSWMVSIIYYLFGISEFMIRVLNALMSTLVIVYSYRITRYIFGEANNAPFYTSLTLSLFPILIRFSSSFASRETLILFMIVLTIDRLILFYRSNNLLRIVESLCYSLIAAALHISLILLFVGIFIVMNGWSHKQSKLKSEKYLKKIIWFIMVSFLMVFVFYMFRNGLGAGKLSLGRGNNIVEKLSSIQESSAIGRANYLSGITSTNPFILVLLSPIRIIYFMFSPFFWMVKEPIDILGLVDGLMYLILFVKAFRNIRESSDLIKTNRVFAAVTIVTLLIIFLLAQTTSNYGTAMRHRAKILPLLVILASPKIKRRSSKRQHLVGGIK